MTKDAVEATIASREATHGNFEKRAQLCDRLINEIFGAREMLSSHMPSYQRQAIRMICDKLSRIACGNSNEVDHWHDIQGYAALVEESILYEDNRDTNAVKAS